MAFLVILDLDRCTLGKFSYLLVLIKYHKSQTLRRRDSRYILSSGSDFNKIIFRMGGMNHPGMSMDNRMMGINPPMMTSQGMSGHHGYGQGGYPWPRPYH